MKKIKISYENIKFIENINNSYIKNKNKKFKIFFKKNKKKNKNNLKYKVKKIINFYRNFGFIYSDINPLKKKKKLNFNYFKIKKYKYKINKYIKKYTYFKNKINNIKKLKKILEKTYCNKIGYEFNYIKNYKENKWIKKKIENKLNKYKFNKLEKKEILKYLIYTKEFEKCINNKFLAQKRFSLEGSESFIILLKFLLKFINKKYKINEIIIGMAHRGRLNTLVNFMGKNINKIFKEFKGKKLKNNFSGDVKYHKGYCSTILLNNKKILNLILLYNPSHLEKINPILQGITKNRKNFFKKNIIPILIHGDSSFSGQGIVMETLNLQKINGYSNNGTIHIIINNQIGFTTSNNKNQRSTKFCSDIAKMFEMPVLHVNSNSVEKVIIVLKFALDYKIKFKKDIIINLISYRKLGHNEQDNPNITQPLMYKKIKNIKEIKKIYNNKLLKKNIINNNYIIKIKNEFYNNIKNNNLINYPIKNIKNKIFYINKNIKNKIIITKISYKKIKYLISKIIKIPKIINIHPLIKKIFKNKKINFKNKIIDWSTSENLLFSSILSEGFSIRITGQDVSRGTFSNRHAVIFDQIYKKKYIPLKKISFKKSKFEINNTILSEEAILGFEYGYSISNSKNITIWEAQFGDFSNCAQVIIDQFITSGEKKWNISSNLIIFLPHGYEGQGPEHSSSRIERFLQLSSNNNIVISQPNNSSQLFHLIRKQIYNNKIKPLIVLTPKSLLRNKNISSKIKEFTNGFFRPINFNNDKILFFNKIKYLAFCSGKIYYDLNKIYIKNNLKNVFIFSLDKIYPFPKKIFFSILNKFKKIKKIFWIQDEPKNQGIWKYFKYIVSKKYKKIIFIGRKNNSSTSSGSFINHCKEKNKIINFFLKKTKNEN
ncbi:2-oxoglutarate dehydrogenase, E1 subunit [Candidatus Zinderia insecticola CARI]|uniref:oxoglutarate dehydrogenase (succinyl-transferring) n=1 Tax=Zinderia insecticola (strain CARI) TaxID=871271 RepID=E0TIZ1_ZINIC|nr:2-oxoglutarate dehydrogenase, E1 subunit [Candidatus Zinderia insecticola CARI]